MNPRSSKTAFTDAEHADLRAQVAKLKVAEDLSQADIAREAEIPDSSLSQYLGDKYPNETGKAEIATKLFRWITARQQAAKLRRRGAVTPSFLELEGANEIADSLAYAREFAGLVIIAGEPGVGKTATARQFTHDHPRTFYAVMNGTSTGTPTMLLALLAGVGVHDAKGTPQALFNRLLAILVETKSLLIVDEAQHLTHAAFDTLRALYDAGEAEGLGIAILGNQEAYTRVGTTGSKAEFAQVSSRFDDRQLIMAPHGKDARKLGAAWAEANGEVLTAKELDFCEFMASKPGGLRNISKAMKQAIVAARGADQPLTLEHLQGAFAQLTGRAIAA